MKVGDIMTFPYSEPQYIYRPKPGDLVRYDNSVALVTKTKGDDPMYKNFVEVLTSHGRKIMINRGNLEVTK